MKWEGSVACATGRRSLRRGGGLAGEASGGGWSECGGCRVNRNEALASHGGSQVLGGALPLCSPLYSVCSYDNLCGDCEKLG